ncbi:MAG: hypothetical protein CYG59_25410, partial [Chloroflexi bacterium]
MRKLIPYPWVLFSALVLIITMVPLFLYRDLLVQGQNLQPNVKHAPPTQIPNVRVLGAPPDPRLVAAVDPFDTNEGAETAAPQLTIPGHGEVNIAQKPFTPATGVEALPDEATVCDKAVQVAAVALMARGKPYSQGGHLKGDPRDGTGHFLPRNGPNSFDCSGLVWWAYRSVGMNVGWVARQQAHNGIPIECDLDDLRGTETTCWKPGDLIFLDRNHPAFPDKVVGDHVAMYVRDGLFIDCYNHAVGCIFHDVKPDAAYAYFWRARRILDCANSTKLPDIASPSIAAPAKFQDAPLKPGAQGKDVRHLQELLNDLHEKAPEVQP